jgi:ABC-type proline/glycine betaine transport system ATPase subunit
MLSSADNYPYQLSGGMRQRVAIARALAMDAPILLFDEPFGALDVKNRHALQDLVEELWYSDGQRKTAVFVTHDIGLAYYVSDRVFIMHGGEIVEAGTPDEVTQNPKSPHTLRLLDDIPDINREWIRE